MSNPLPQSALDIRNAVRRREVSAVEVARAAMDRLAAVEPRIGAFLQVFAEHALDQARAVDTRIGSGEAHDGRLALAGVPIAIKDNICLAFGRTSCGSRMLEQYESPYTATAAERLIDAGAVIIGKTNLDEFGMGSSTENSAFPPTRNPWDLQRVPGGSSGGSAAAVAARVVPLALGSDTGGSIRQPASHCGVVGIKPSYGRVSRYGLVAYASSLDTIGTLAPTVADAAAGLELMSGPDPRDATCAGRAAPSLLGQIERPIDGLTIGLVKQNEGNDPEVSRVLAEAAGIFRKMGARVIDVDLPLLHYAVAAYYIVAPAEASSNLARFDGVRYGRRAIVPASVTTDALGELYRRSRAEGLGPEVQKRILLGTHVLSAGYYDAYYATAQKARRLIKRDFERCFTGEGPEAGPACHALVMPVSPGPAFPLGAKRTDPLAMYLEDVYTVGVSLAGLPAASVPAGMAKLPDGRELPVGIQIIASMYEEPALIRIARAFERETPWGRRVPPLSSPS
jgi:aspartyl-tRNA(Asn)/glutamyl-tRNA(Gln) amidotransferase subunit A